MTLKVRALVSAFIPSWYNASASVISKFITFLSVDWELRTKTACVSLAYVGLLHSVGISISQH